LVDAESREHATNDAGLPAGAPVPAEAVPTQTPPQVATFGGATMVRREIAPIPRRPERRAPGEERAPVALLRSIRARIQSAKARGDGRAEAEAQRALCLVLTGRGVALDEAIAAGRRALALAGDDETLRRALSAALASVGEPGLASAVLRPVVESLAARAARGDGAAADAAVEDLLAMGDFALRGGDVEAAIESYRSVAHVAPDRTEGQERVARMRALAPDAISAEVAARAYIAAAKKHQIAGRDAEALEALARAFEADPTGPLAAQVLADALDELGRHAAADAVRAEHAARLAANAAREGGEEAAARAKAVHAHRRVLARARDDRATLVAAALAELIEACATRLPADRWPRVTKLQDALEPLRDLAKAVRWMRARAATGDDRVAALEAIASAPEVPRDEQLEALGELVELRPDDERPLSMLRERALGAPYGDRSSLDALVDGLVRALCRDTFSAATSATHAARARELAMWADERLGDAGLARWAWEQVLRADPNDARAKEELARVTRRLEISGDAAVHARETLEVATDPLTRGAAARRCVEVLLHRPGERDALAAALGRLAEESGLDVASVPLLRRARPHLSLPALDALLHQLSRASSAAGDAALLLRVETALRLRDVDGARRLLEERDAARPSAEIAAARIAFEIAFGEGAQLAAAIAALPAETPREKAAVLAAGAYAARLHGEGALCRQLAEEALRRDARDVRGAYELAELCVVDTAAMPPALAGAALERALAGIGARARWAMQLAALTEQADEPAMAAAWTRRAWSLCPGDLVIARAWLARAASFGDAELLVEVLSATTGALATMAPIAEDVANALGALAALAPRLAEDAQQALLAIGGARIRPVRAAMLTTSERDPKLWCAVAERWLASGASAAERSSVLLAMAERLAAIDPSASAELASRMLAEGESTQEQRAQARRILLDFAGASLDGDAQIAVGEAVAQRASRELWARLEGPRARLDESGNELAQSVADVQRALGRDLWDLAEDVDGAMRAWIGGAVLLGAAGLDRLEADLDAFGDDATTRGTLLELARRAERLHHHPRGAFIEVCAESLRARAWERALHRPPAWIEPLSLAREAAASAPDAASLIPAFEALAARTERPDVLHDLFEIAGGRVAGRFGERGLRYRAARVLDRLGRTDEALDQAVRAFGAVPGEGAMTMLMERLAKVAGRLDVAVSALVEAAEQSEDSDKRALWLDRAAALAREAFPDPVDRVDLTLRLFLTAPSAKSVGAVVSGIREAIAADGGGAEAWMARLLRAHRRVDGKLGYVDRLPVLAVVAEAVGELSGVARALDLVAKGAESTPVADMDPLRAVGQTLGALDPAAALAWLDANGGGGVARAHVAWGAGDADRAIALLVETAPVIDEFDFQADSSEGHRRELSLLELWSRAAKDKLALATAFAHFGIETQAPASRDRAARALAEGQLSEAAEAIASSWQARAQLPDEELDEIIALAREVHPKLGRHDQLVAMLIERAEHQSDERAAQLWREIAELRRGPLGDPRGALEALFEAGRASPRDEALWIEIEALAERESAPDRLAAALSHLLPRARPERRVHLLRKLARVLELDLGRDAEAAERWAELVRLLPLDPEAADALERIAERRGDRRGLVELLRARASRLPVGHAERTRALKAVARELAGQSGRRGEVLGALREVHQQNPGDVDVALQLAEVARAAGDLGTASDAYARALAVTPAGSQRTHLALEAARILLALHDREGASRLLADATLIVGASSPIPPREELSLQLDVLRLRLEVAIARGDVRDEALTRIRLAELDVDAEPARKAENCAAAAKTLLAMGERERARDLAWTAARAAPGDASHAALLAELEFSGSRAREPGKTTPVDVELLALLTQVGTHANGPLDALATVAFARAELLDAAHGGGAGYRQLHAWPEAVRERPIVQLAIAERLADEWSFGPAAIAFERAFAGDFHAFRRPGPTALRAADVAARANDAPRARAFLELAARDPACRVDARRHAVELARTLGDREGALRGLERLAAESTGTVRAEALAEQARMLRSDDPERAVDLMQLAIAALDGADPIRHELRRELAQIEAQREERDLPPGAPPSLRDSGRLSRPSHPPLGPEARTSSPPQPTDRGLGDGGGDPAEKRMPPSDPPQGEGVAARKWLSAHGHSEPPPEHPRTAVDSDTSMTLARPASRRPPPMPDPNGDGASRGTTSAAPTAIPAAPSLPTAIAPMAPVADAGPANATSEASGGQDEQLTDQPRMTMLGMPAAAVAVPTIPRPATATGAALDLATIEKLAQDASAPTAERIRAWKTLGEASHEQGRDEDATRQFLAALELGDVPAGDAAAEILASSPQRAPDLLLVRRRQAFLLPGHRAVLDGLYDAAQRTRDLTFARAIDHVRRAFDPVAGPVPPPPLEAQIDRPDLVVPMLERRAAPAATEALRLVWEHGAHLFRRDLSMYGLGPIERIQGLWQPIGKLVAAAERLLGAARVPVYLRQRAGRDVEAVLTAPPSVLLGGECRDDDADVRYLLGAGLIASLGAHCLMLAQGEGSARATWNALLSAFGPPEFGRGVSPEIGRLAASLWQSIPRGAQRRLGELLGQAPPTFEVAIAGARQVSRRGGLYLSGDLAATLRAALGDAAAPPLSNDPTWLAYVCAEQPEIADLVRLAISPEFAEARWRAVNAPGPRRTQSSGGMPSQRG
jgi:hypothetical protein